jgi:hypothetical protein
VSITTSSFENWRVLGEPVLEVLEFSLSAVVDTSLVVLWIENESWVSSDLDAIGFVLGSIELGDDNILIILIMLTKLIPNWSELLAMAAPWGIVLNENIFAGILDNFIEILADNDGNWLTGVVNWLLGLEEWLNLSIEDILNVGSNRLDS